MSIYMSSSAYRKTVIVNYIIGTQIIFILCEQNRLITYDYDFTIRWRMYENTYLKLLGLPEFVKIPSKASYSTFPTYEMSL